MQIRKLKTKMGFLVLAKHGLNKYGIKRPKIGLIFGGEKTVEREREKRRREEEEEEEGGAKIKQSQAPKRYGTTNLE